MVQQARAKRRAADIGGPVRQCALTRERRAQGDLIRFALDPEERVVPDLKNRLPGRGVWITARREAVARAAKKGIFARGFSRKVTTDPNLAGQVEALLERSALERLALANKAGLVTTGFTKVAEKVAQGSVFVLLHAADAAPGGREKLGGKARAPAIAPVDSLNSRQLSLALGRSNVVHAALSEGGAAESFLNAVGRLEQYRSSGAALDPAGGSVTETV